MKVVVDFLKRKKNWICFGFVETAASSSEEIYLFGNIKNINVIRRIQSKYTNISSNILSIKGFIK